MSDYLDTALAEALFDKLDGETFTGRIASCPGVIAFGTTLRECEESLRSTLEDWVLVGLKLGHPLPVSGLGFDGPFSGTRHQFMVIGSYRLAFLMDVIPLTPGCRRW